MEAISFGQVVRNSWRDAWGFFRDRLGTSLVVTLLLLLLTYVGLTLSPRLGPSVQADLHPSLLRGLVAGLLVIAQAALKMGLTVQICRYVLLDDASRHAPFFGKPFWRYVGTALAAGLTGAGIGFVMVLIAVIAAAVLILGTHGVHFDPHQMPLGLTLALIVVLSIALIVTIVLIFVPMTLLLVHAAANRKFNWRAARHDARGHFWSVLGAFFVTSLPVWILSLPALLSIPMSLHAWQDAGNPQTGVWYAATFSQTLLSLLILFISSSCSAWLYRRFTDQLLSAS
jgi:hypothetical protein